MPRQIGGGYYQVKDFDALNLALREIWDRLDALGGNRGIYPHEDDLLIEAAGKGLVVKDSQKPPHYWRIRVADTGALITEDLGTVRP